MRTHKRFIGDKAAAARLWPFARKKLAEVETLLRQTGGAAFTKTVSINPSNWIRIQVVGSDAHVTIHAESPQADLFAAMDHYLVAFRASGTVVKAKDYYPLAVSRMAEMPRGQFVAAFYNWDQANHDNSVRRLTAQMGEVWRHDVPRPDPDSDYTGYIWGVAADPNGNAAYHVDSYKHTRKLDAAGESVWTRDDFGQGDTGQVYELAFDSEGNLFEAGKVIDSSDTDWARILKRDPDGNVLWLLDDAPRDDGSSYDYHKSVAITPEGGAVAGRADGAVTKANPDGTAAWRIAPVVNAAEVKAIRTDSAGYIYAPLFYAGKLRKIDPDGTEVWRSTDLVEQAFSVAVQYQVPEETADQEVFFGGWDNDYPRILARLDSVDGALIWDNHRYTGAITQDLLRVATTP